MGGGQVCFGSEGILAQLHLHTDFPPAGGTALCHRCPGPMQQKSGGCAELPPLLTVLQCRCTTVSG